MVALAVLIVALFTFIAVAPALTGAFTANKALYSGSLTGLPLVILLFPDGRLPSGRWRWPVAAYLAVAAGAVLATAGVLEAAVGHRVIIRGDGSLTTFGHGPVMAEPVMGRELHPVGG